MAQAGYTPIQLYYSTTTTNAPSAGNLADGELAINTADGKLFYKDNLGAVQVIATKAAASGDVAGPASATDNAIARFDGTTGKLIQNSAVTVADTTGDITGGFYRAQAAATQDAVVVQGRAGGTSSYAVTLTPTTLTASRTLTLPNASGTVATIGNAIAFSIVFGL